MYEAANSARSDDSQLPGIHVVTVDVERSPHQFPIDFTDNENLPSNTDEAYDFYEAHQETLIPIWVDVAVDLVYERTNIETITWSTRVDDLYQLDHSTRDYVREVRCLGRHWRSDSTIECWPNLISAVRSWAIISVATDAMAAETQGPIRYGCNNTNASQLQLACLCFNMCAIWFQHIVHMLMTYWRGISVPSDEKCWENPLGVTLCAGGPAEIF